MVIGLNALAILALTISIDCLTLGADDERKGLGGLERSVNTIEGRWIVALGDEYGNTASGNGWLRRIERCNTQLGGFFACVGFRLPGWCLKGFGVSIAFSGRKMGGKKILWSTMLRQYVSQVSRGYK